MKPYRVIYYMTADPCPHLWADYADSATALRDAAALMRISTICRCQVIVSEPLTNQKER